MSLLFRAPPGAAEAPCAVCGDPTLERLTEGDGHVPVCSSFCAHAWPRVRLLYRAAEAATLVYRAWDEDRSHVNKMLAMGCALRDAGFEVVSAPRAGHDTPEGT